MKQQSKTALVKVSVTAVCIAMTAMCGMFMRGLSDVIYYVSVIALFLTSACFCLIDEQKYPHLSRTVLVCAVFVLVAVAAYMLFYLTGINERFTDFDALRDFIRASGFWGFAVFIGITVFEVVILPIPAAVTILLGVAIYGPTVGFVLSTVGTVIGSLISFMLGKVFGRRLCNWMFGEESTEKYARLLNEKGRFVFIIMLLFPAFPDDMLCMIAGITTMSYGYFTLVCVLTRPVMIGFTAYLGSGAIPFSGWGIPVWISLVCLMFVAFIVVNSIKTKIVKRKRK